MRTARRRTAVRSASVSVCLLALTAVVPALLAVSQPAFAQSFTYNPLPPQRTAPPARSTDDGQMLVQAQEVNYDNVNSLVAAVGGVQIFYNGTTLEADRVTYNQKTKRLTADGNVRLTDQEGRITYAQHLELSDDYRDGFVDSLHVDTADRTRMAATRADRSGGNFTVFQNGVYTACEACKEDPRKPPLWQVKAARIIHDQGEKMLYFESARLEFLGVPMAYLPYFYTPDPTVKRKTGFLMPMFSSSSKYGVGFQAPYYFALAPDYDLTVTPRITTKQGLLMQAQFRQRLINGSYDIRAYGIRQLDKDEFLRDGGPSTPGYRDWRGAVETSGRFAINDRWSWGWDGTLVSDRTFFQDYSLGRFRSPVAVFSNVPTDAISQLYLTGVGTRSFFDARTMYFYGFSEADVQRQIPIIHPVIDYANVLNRPVFGGELSFRANLTSLSREAVSYNPISATAQSLGLCLPTSADPMVKTPLNCLLRGIGGDYTRLSGEATWRRTFTDSIGQIWTPFASVRADINHANIQNDIGTSNFLPTGDITAGRVMPAVGFEYRYPFISAQSWGSQTIEPIAQVIIRPNEQMIGRLPNEDAQSLVFDDTNLFEVDKFSGWDRTEGGGRANLGIQGTTQFDRGGFVNFLFGQSYHLFGQNSYAVGDLTNTGLNSGLETDRSDYVTRLSYQPNSMLSFSARSRLDESSWEMRRLELETRASFDRWTVSLLYGNYDKQPELGFLTRREGLLGTASVKVAENWVVSGGLRYDLLADKINQTIVGAGYVDDCFVLAMNYITDYGFSGNPVADHRFMLQIGLRTIGTTSFNQSTTSSSSSGGSSLFGQ
ncbi:LPS-assembly protein LptD [Bradyrhizobium sp. LHD-71]|uniref:LPS-assembly protein LptD n=1 Tax=Bradyrhizobium sp. LHD-71 TaxID=3072141 RepID=UPI00280EC747|nr:LPS-assembly protein LptD [Bradyrhizobium sp. LHD-71]MDQ8729887.1 LPS-assembly protein LptD [Bradyrhizobium sp. LHD-71]